ncbi:hypothetical protein LX36DRAFT_153094 [Colletotrichum falcatum]|nr:hypothetical protein LX36DRAFT_153094 [Colletotrichum falcatum]
MKPWITSRRGIDLDQGPVWFHCRGKDGRRRILRDGAYYLDARSTQDTSTLALSTLNLSSHPFVHATHALLALHAAMLVLPGTTLRPGLPTAESRVVCQPASRSQSLTPAHGISLCPRLPRGGRVSACSQPASGDAGSSLAFLLWAFGISARGWCMRPCQLLLRSIEMRPSCWNPSSEL